MNLEFSLEAKRHPASPDIAFEVDRIVS